MKESNKISITKSRSVSSTEKKCVCAKTIFEETLAKCSPCSEFHPSETVFLRNYKPYSLLVGWFPVFMIYSMKIIRQIILFSMIL